MGAMARIRAGGRAVRAWLCQAGQVTRKATHAHGADRTGLGNLIETCALNNAGDAMVTVAMAGTIFFGLDVNQARSQVALYLVVTMAPFAIIAPLIGPVLDRLRSARRAAIAGTFVGRGLLCWGMAGAVLHGDQVTFLPAAFGALVLSKAFGILRTAMMPRVLPEEITLVTANARASFAGLITAAVVTPLAAGIGVLIGQDWVLRAGTLLFFVGAALGMRLPKHVETPETDEEPPPTIPSPAPGEPVADTSRWRTLLRVGSIVGDAMRANAVLRAFSGFLILYLAFMLRGKRFDPVSPTVALGMLAASAGIGGLVGTALGALATGPRMRAPQVLVLATLAFTTAVTAAAAAFFGLWAALVVAFVGAFGQSLGKLSLDAVVQHEIGEEIRSSTFAVSETLHQLAWVFGGLAGLGMSMIAHGRVALAVAALSLGASVVWLLARGAHRHLSGSGSRSRRTPRRSRRDPTPIESAPTPPG